MTTSVPPSRPKRDAASRSESSKSGSSSHNFQDTKHEGDGSVQILGRSYLNRLYTGMCTKLKKCTNNLRFDVGGIHFSLFHFTIINNATNSANDVDESSKTPTKTRKSQKKRYPSRRDRRKISGVRPVN